MLDQLINPPEFQKDHTLPAPKEDAIVQLTDNLPVAVTGVLQCTAIFFYNPNNGRRVAAHFGGWRGKRRPNTDDLTPAWTWVTGEWGAEHTVVTVCKNNSSPENSIDEVLPHLKGLVGMPEIIVEEYAGDCFYMFSDGKLFGGGQPTQSRRGFGSRGGGNNTINNK